MCIAKVLIRLIRGIGYPLSLRRLFCVMAGKHTSPIELELKNGPCCFLLILYTFTCRIITYNIHTYYIRVLINAIRAVGDCFAKEEIAIKIFPLNLIPIRIDQIGKFSAFVCQ